MNDNPGPGKFKINSYFKLMSLGKYDVLFKRISKNRSKLKCTFGITYDQRKFAVSVKFLIH